MRAWHWQGKELIHDDEEETLIPRHAHGRISRARQKCDLASLNVVSMTNQIYTSTCRNAAGEIEETEQIGMGSTEG